MHELDKEKVVAVLNKILEMELAGVVRYTHYSLLVFGYSRIPIVSWLRDQATEQDVVLLKGSRKYRMEEIVEAFRSGAA